MCLPQTHGWFYSLVVAVIILFGNAFSVAAAAPSLNLKAFLPGGAKVILNIITITRYKSHFNGMIYYGILTARGQVDNAPVFCHYE